METVSSIREFHNVLNGELVPASFGRKIDSINPANGKVWARVPGSTAEDAENAVAAAKQAFPKWARYSAMERAAFLRQIGDLIAQHGEELAMLETNDCGWVIRETSYGLIPTLTSIWYDAAGAASVASRGETIQLSPTSFGYTLREPLGVVVGILPWNAPLFTFTIKAAYALAAGNAVIIKPSEFASVSSLRYGELLNTILPPGIVNVVSGDREVGEALVRHREVNRVTLTGSGNTAKAIVRSTAQAPKPLTFELGGKSPNIVFADANLEKAVEGVTTNGIFTGNAGQICVGGSRILIQRPIFEEMVSLMKEKMREELRLGDPLDPSTTMGPIANEVQYNKVRNFIEIGVQEGGTILTGGRSGEEALSVKDARFSNGFWVEPTLIQVQRNSLRICQEEIFGPVATVMSFDTEEEALEIANDTSFGLGAGVWTTNLACAQRMIKNLQSGNVWVNTYRRVGPELPFGGVKESGFGRDSILENTQEKTCVIEEG
ncbi:aldehyde dehydrogenase family protein [Neobacillus mesonae]|uniref:Aldehyde dehydrogenase n=1 Tax=Neobacillus mesonae TaxID=1193713 RepID=A0A3T0I0F1_9BACI|nr:aldehyde dehydrogenase family protein [Neobacillus mesonae]AZU62648.1 aldehyde dehydrogenase [Neobacillus mesonae]